MQYSTTYFVFELELSFGQTIPNKVDFLNKTFTLTFSFNVHSLIFKRALLHFVPFDCQCSGLIAVRAVLPFLQTCYSTVDIIFLFTKLFFLVKKLKKSVDQEFQVKWSEFQIPIPNSIGQIGRSSSKKHDCLLKRQKRL